MSRSDCPHLPTPLLAVHQDLQKITSSFFALVGFSERKVSIEIIGSRFYILRSNVHSQMPKKTHQTRSSEVLVIVICDIRYKLPRAASLLESEDHRLEFLP